MGQDRNWSDIIAHLCVALAAIGGIKLAGIVLVGMSAYKLYTGTFFVNQTQRQKKLRNVSDEVNRIIAAPQ